MVVVGVSMMDTYNEDDVESGDKWWLKLFLHTGEIKENISNLPVTSLLLSHPLPPPTPLCLCTALHPLIYSVSVAMHRQKCVMCLGLQTIRLGRW